MFNSLHVNRPTLKVRASIESTEAPRTSGTECRCELTSDARAGGSPFTGGSAIASRGMMHDCHAIHVGFPSSPSLSPPRGGRGNRTGISILDLVVFIVPRSKEFPNYSNNLLGSFMKMEKIILIRFSLNY